MPSEITLLECFSVIPVLTSPNAGFWPDDSPSTCYNCLHNRQRFRNSSRDSSSCRGVIIKRQEHKHYTKKIKLAAPRDGKVSEDNRNQKRKKYLQFWSVAHLQQFENFHMSVKYQTWNQATKQHVPLHPSGRYPIPYLQYQHFQRGAPWRAHCQLVLSATATAVVCTSATIILL